MPKPWNEWKDSYQVCLLLHGVDVCSQGQLKLAHDMAADLYAQGMGEMDAVEEALKAVRTADPSALVDAELSMAKRGEEIRPKMEKLWRSLGIDPKDWPT